MANSHKIKIFDGLFKADVEDAVNEWLKDTNSSIKIFDMMVSGNFRDGIVIVVAYKECETDFDEDAPNYGPN